MRKHSKLIKVDELLNGLINERNWEQNFALGQLRIEWPKVVGQNVSKHTLPKFIRNKKLFIEVDSPIWSTQLNYLKDQVIKTINSYYREEIVNDVYFQIKKEYKKE